ncbi:MAG: hypothetical protein IJY04_01470 [Clostridia bacterium]|nr:hypothetical protein [Clostridia bacterium]
MADERKRIPTECANRSDNNFRCASAETGFYTPDKDGADCVDCPNYVYAPSRKEEKEATAESDAVKGSAFGTVMLVVFAILVAVGLFFGSVLINSLVG